MTKYNELAIQRYWNSLSTETVLKTTDNAVVNIISAGTWNSSGGPDFLNARIKLEDKIIAGDIEIHLRASDWFRHNHEPNPAYFNVILHVALVDDLTSEQRELLPPLVILKKIKFSDDVLPNVKPGICSRSFIGRSREEMLEFLEAAGMERFYEKSLKLTSEALTEGIERATLRSAFEALGYKNNRDNFIELFNRFFEYSENIRIQHYEVILWGESGLLPDPAVSPPAKPLLEFETACWNQWWLIRIKSRPDIKWRRGASRPFNSPERRIAATVQFVRMFGEKPLQHVVEIANRMPTYHDFNQRLLEMLQLDDPLWNHWTNFYSPLKSSSAVLGEARALEMAVNVLLPALAAYGKINKIDGLAEFAAKAWRQLPPLQKNIVTRTAAAKWFGDHPYRKLIYTNAASSQGAMLLYRKFCESCSSDCAGCRLNNSLC